jgi:hypothetical protein
MRKMTGDERIVQIMPASGFYSVYCDESKVGFDMIIQVEVVAWGLRADGGVVAMDWQSEGILAESGAFAANYIGLVHGMVVEGSKDAEWIMRDCEEYKKSVEKVWDKRHGGPEQCQAS